jgi:hypothetical protein
MVSSNEELRIELNWLRSENEALKDVIAIQKEEIQRLREAAADAVFEAKTKAIAARQQEMIAGVPIEELYKPVDR